jgi:predicted lactoylglutathione lyase
MAPTASFVAAYGKAACASPLREEAKMKARISVLTLAVADLERSLAFYRDGLGLPTNGIVGREFEHGAVVFFELSGGLKLALWRHDDIAHDTGLEKTTVSPTAVTIGYNVGRRGEVDDVMDQALRAGATVVKKAQTTFYGGYAGYFADLDSHVWEVVFNPANLPGDD